MAIKFSIGALIKGLRVFFAIFMVVIYLGMSVLFMINFFHFSQTTPWLIMRWTFAIILLIYGIYRAKRAYSNGWDY